MRIGRGVWVGTVLLATAAACSTGVNTGFEPDEGGAPHYDGGGSGDGGGHPGAGGDATAEAGGDAGADASEAAAASEAGAEGGGGDAHADASGDGATTSGDGATASDGGGPDAGADAASEAGLDAPVEAQPPAEAGPEGGADAVAEASRDAAPEAAPEAGPDAAGDAKPDAITIVAPTCDGVVAPGEYGGAGNQAAASTGQTWLMTWDETNLYVAIENANVNEGCVVYLAVDPGSDAGPPGGATSGRLYDSTDLTGLPFPALLVVYAHDGYTEARKAAGGAWSAAPDTTSVHQCDNGTTQVREEVIPWSLVGGRPASFGWLGYVAANGNSNPQGYIYGQLPADNPGGGPANADTYPHYFVVPDATPGVGLPFAHEH